MVSSFANIEHRGKYNDGYDILSQERPMPFPQPTALERDQLLKFYFFDQPGLFYGIHFTDPV